MRLLFTLLLLVCPIAKGAVGDILSVTVRSDGFTADVVVAGFTTNATYTPGFVATNVSQSGARMVLTVTSQGYTGTNLGTTTRTIYGTAIMRLPYPAETSTEGPGSTKDETLSGTNLTARISLSDYVYADDEVGSGKSGTDISVTFLSGFVTNSGGSSEASGATTLAVTNNSAVAYPGGYGQNDFLSGACVADRVKSDFYIAANARHRFPIAAVKFTATGQTSGHSQQVVATTQTGVQRAGSSLYANCHRGLIPLSGFTQGELIDCSWVSYPTVGDESSIFDTSSRTNVLEEPRGWNRFTVVCDKNNALDSAYYVGPTGNDTTGSGTSGSPWLTISKASTNGNIVYLQAGTNNFGSSLTRRVVNEWVVVQPAPGVDRSNVVVMLNATTRGYAVSRFAVSNVTVKLAGTTSWADGSNTNVIRWIGCNFDSSGVGAPTTSPGYRSIVSYFHNCVGDLGPTEWALRSFSSDRLAYQFDGCSFGSGGVGNAYYRVTSSKATVSGWGMADKLSTNPSVSDDNQIIENNAIYNGGSTADPIIVMGAVLARSIGTSIAGNIFEKNASTAPAVQIYADGTTNTAANIHQRQNTITGERENLGYNETSTNSLARDHFLVQFCAFRDWNNKDDTFGTPSGNRVGGWAIGYGVGSRGNRAEIQTFSGEFGGLDFEEVGDDGIGYVDNASYTGDGTGTGDYTPSATSVLRNRIPAGGAYFAVDLFGTAWGNSGDGSSGAVQRAADLVTLSPSIFFFRR